MDQAAANPYEGVFENLLSRIAPLKLGVAAGLVAGVVCGAAGAAGLFEPDSSLAVTVVLAAGCGFLMGCLVAIIRNALVGAHLRIIWTRFHHHVANDVLDRMS